MTYEERLHYNGKMLGLPMCALIGLAIYAFVRGPQHLLLPQALIDTLYPYALLPWEWPFAEGLSLFQQQFVVLALIGVTMQAVVGLPAILPYMPEMKALPDARRNSFVNAPIVLMLCLMARLWFIGDTSNVLSSDAHNTGGQFINLMSPLLVDLSSFLFVTFAYCAVIYLKAYRYGE